MTKSEDTNWIVERARATGFDLCGVVRAEKFPELAQYKDWLASGYAGEMKYLSDPRRQDPGLVMEDVRSVIVCALNYNTDAPYSVSVATKISSDERPKGWISRYAWGDDYHEVMWKKLNQLTAEMQEQFATPFETRGYADTGPIAERVFAKHAGLGWIGKNTLLLNRELGSWFFLGVLMTSLELEPTLGPGDALVPDYCGSCRKCIDACPTEALLEFRVMDARRCISYLTIELRGAIPEEFREGMGWQVYGCDICQDVCPYNQKAPVTGLQEFQPRKTATEESLLQPNLLWLAGLQEGEFREVFGGSAMKRAKWKGLVRNACIALGNSKLERGTVAHSDAKKLLGRLAETSEIHIAESAQWALQRIQ
jgi:epoxyqueuosine reductase